MGEFSSTNLCQPPLTLLVAGAMLVSYANAQKGKHFMAPTEATSRACFGANGIALKEAIFDERVLSLEDAAFIETSRLRKVPPITAVTYPIKHR